MNMAKPKRRIHLQAAVGAILSLLLLICGCSTAPSFRETPVKGRSYKINGQWYHPITSSKGFRQSGLASWYGAPFHGRKTASGETYNMHAKTAAHKVLPLGTFVLVKNKDNGKQTVVRINDRGPFVRGRIIDLSYRAARDVDMIGPGTAEVEILAMEKGKADPRQSQTVHADFYSGDFTVQVGAFVRRNLAERLQNKLLQTHEHVNITQVTRKSETFYRVRVGRLSSLENAEKIEARLIRIGYENAFAVACDDE
ncbi:MAG: septal ring lytic transglycosylase RlpA family protein [Desulfobacterales bacterium]|nr:septal ring lytic transglycosylase RlpA family protein [Desulfobacterales bacterium]